MIQESIRHLVGNRTAPAPAAAKPITEAWTVESAIDAVIGACGTDCDKLRKGLAALSKGQLKKVYCAATGTAEANCDMEDDAKEDAKEGAEKKESKAEEKAEKDEKKEEKKD
jgi:hypothetical protein